MNALNLLGFPGALLAVTCLAACSFGPSPVKPPSIDASDAAEQAISSFDTDGDGAIGGTELEKAPGIKAALKNLDPDGDGKVTADAIEERIEAWQATGTGLVALRCTVVMDGRPLRGATITFDPEPFLGDNVKVAIGTTDAYGIASITIPKEQRPSPETPPGVQFALFRVRVSRIENGQESIPIHYNAETILGQEVSYDDPRVQNGVVYELTSK